MNKNKIILFLISLFALTACSSINEYLPSFLTEGSTPAVIQEAVSSRVNPEKKSMYFLLHDSQKVVLL